MDSQLSATPNRRKTSAFLPVVRNENEMAAFPLFAAPLNEREEGIF
jgi:hypothetical protein